MPLNQFPREAGVGVIFSVFVVFGFGLELGFFAGAGGGVTSAVETVDVELWICVGSGTTGKPI
jgi:hypothetical protein